MTTRPDCRSVAISTAPLEMAEGVVAEARIATEEDPIGNPRKSSVAS